MRGSWGLYDSRLSHNSLEGLIELYRFPMMFRVESFPSIVFLVTSLFLSSYLQLPVAWCRPVDVFKHEVMTPVKAAQVAISAGPFAKHAQGPRGVPGILLQRRLHVSVRSRSLVASKFEKTRERKMLFDARGCASQDLTIIQGPVSSTTGIPTFSVQIINLSGDCALGSIHVACGNWASATPVDPSVFTRLSYNDCLVNNGRPLSSQGSISFQYSNSAMYPMSITSASTECSP